MLVTGKVLMAIFLSVTKPVLFTVRIHCNLVITLILAAKRNERYNEMHLLNGMNCIVMDL